MDDNTTPPDSANPENQTSEKSKDTIAYETHRKLLDEKKKLQAKLADIEASQKKREEEDLAKKGEVEKILKIREQELNDTRAKLSAFEERQLQAKKLSAVVRGLGAQIDDKWYSVIGSHLDEVVINPESGDVEQMSVTSVVEGLKKSWPEMLKVQRPGMPHDAPQGNGVTTIGYDAWKKLPLKEMKKWKHNQII